MIFLNLNNGPDHYLQFVTLGPGQQIRLSSTANVGEYGILELNELDYSVRWNSDEPVFCTVSSSKCDTLEEARAEFYGMLIAWENDTGCVCTWVSLLGLREYEGTEDGEKYAQVWTDIVLLRGKWEINGTTLRKAE